VVEIDGPGHGRPAIRASDARKDAKLRAAGWTVRRFSDREVYAMLGSSVDARGATRPAAA
jgi:very-short-patch-repair endonuclease